VNPDSATLRYLDPFADCPACGAHPRPENHPNLFAELCGAA
jgi:hypothetical protein